MTHIHDFSKGSKEKEKNELMPESTGESFQLTFFREKVNEKKIFAFLTKNLNSKLKISG